MMEINRAVILVRPHGTYIRNKHKNLIVKTKYITSIIDTDLLLIEDKVGLGIITLAEPKVITLKDFSRLTKYHLITDAERTTWWPNYDTLYAYQITSSKFFRVGLLLDYPQGPQITVKPENVYIRHIYIGMSGYQYKSMYPPRVNILDYYASRLNSVEINSTFYRIPSKSLVQNLLKYNLTYSIKVSQYITHMKKLRHVSGAWKKFYVNLEPLVDHIFCFLFQFSSMFHFTTENYNRLKDLRQILPKSHRYAFEFRHQTWFHNEKITKLFRRYHWTFVIINSTWLNLNPGFNPSLSAYEPTSDFAYIRMHGTTGQYIGSYSKHELRSVWDFLKAHPKLHHAGVYFNNTDSADALPNALTLSKLFNPDNL